MLLARPLDEQEHQLVERWLSEPAEATLFWGQAASDQRHGLEGALDIANRASDRDDLVRAALLHDVGKQRAGLGVVGRTAAELAAKLSLDPSGRLGDHLRHTEIGAALLLEAGSAGVVIDFARHHHGERPATIPPEDWQRLVASDRSSVLRPRNP